MKKIIVCVSVLLIGVSCGNDVEKKAKDEVTKEPVEQSNPNKHSDDVHFEEPTKNDSVHQATNQKTEKVVLDIVEQPIVEERIEPMVESEGNEEEVKPIVTAVEDKQSVAVKKASEPMVITFNHNKFNELLQKHVTPNGVVNYDSFKKEEKKLDSYLGMLKDTKPTSNWSSKKKLAYYINIYNASTIKLILSNYPLKSIMDIPKAWDLPVVKIGDEVFTLNHIENNIIRPTFKEPRIHFAVNCAAVSCPKLSNQAFSESNINTLLQLNTERFLNDSNIGMLQKGKKVELSQIFEWYAVDFGGKENLLKWISNNSKMDLTNSKFKGFIPYNWELNNK